MNKLKIITIKDFIDKFDTDRNQMFELADYVNNDEKIRTLPLVIIKNGDYTPALKTDHEFYNFSSFISMIKNTKLLISNYRDLVYIFKYDRRISDEESNVLLELTQKYLLKELIIRGNTRKELDKID